MVQGGTPLVPTVIGSRLLKGRLRHLVSQRSGQFPPALGQRKARRRNALFHGLSLFQLQPFWWLVKTKPKGKTTSLGGPTLKEDTRSHPGLAWGGQLPWPGRSFGSKAEQVAVGSFWDLVLMVLMENQKEPNPFREGACGCSFFFEGHKEGNHFRWAPTSNAHTTFISAQTKIFRSCEDHVASYGLESKRRPKTLYVGTLNMSSLRQK